MAASGGLVLSWTSGCPGSWIGDVDVQDPPERGVVQPAVGDPALAGGLG